ncbi:MAG: HNH endonuclease, partial [Acidimicrobiia bacterium]
RGTVSSALVLNATYEPLSVVTGRRAVVLVLRGRAAMVEAAEQTWRAEHVALPVPSVVRLTKFVRVPHQRITPVTRRAVFGRDDHRCQYCGAPAESLDHVLPRSRGGGHTWENVVACCRRCNLRKGDRLPSEVGLSLIRRPLRPHRYGWVYARAGTALDPRWHVYLLAESA